MKELKNECENEMKNIQRVIQKMKNGKGNGNSEPPEDFSPEIVDGKKRREAFATSCRAFIENHQMYQEWKSSIFSLKKENKKSELEKENRQIKNMLVQNNSRNNLRITKQRSSGPNIYDAEKIVVSEKPDGTMRKTVVKETIATVTRRKRKISGDDENEVSGEAQRKRTKTIDNILNHINDNSKANKAKMISRIIDDEGGDFAKKVKLSSKVMQENESLSVGETNSLQVGTRSSGFLWRQTRTAFKKTLGFSPLASAKKVQKYRVETMTVKKEDWKVDTKNLYKYKQGKNKAKPQETTVLMVKDLHSYIAKIALSESNDLDLSMKQLPVCYDADAGGGRFVASFAFLNRTDRSVVLHPFLIYEGSDCRANLEMTLGEYTETIDKLEDRPVLINNVDVEVNKFGLALNPKVGKQNHSESFPCAWTNVSKDHLNSENHKGKHHTSDICNSISFLTKNDYDDTSCCKHRK